jgi:hypothetical protein
MNDLAPVQRIACRVGRVGLEVSAHLLSQAQQNLITIIAKRFSIKRKSLNYLSKSTV